MKEVEGAFEFVVAFGKALEFVLGTGLGPECGVVNTPASETVEKNGAASVELHVSKTVAELGFDVFGFETSHILLLEVVAEMLKSDLERPGVVFGPRVGLAFENTHVVPSEGLPGSQLGANMDECQIWELDLTAVDTVGIQDTPAGQQLGFASCFQLSTAVVGTDSGNSLQGKTYKGWALGRML